jgi:hypothetical protein
VWRQGATLKHLEDFLGIPLAKIPVRRKPVGRWKTDEGVHYFEFFEEDMRELGYGPLPAGENRPRFARRARTARDRKPRLVRPPRAGQQA